MDSDLWRFLNDAFDAPPCLKYTGLYRHWRPEDVHEELELGCALFRTIVRRAHDCNQTQKRRPTITQLMILSIIDDMVDKNDAEAKNRLFRRIMNPFTRARLDVYVAVIECTPPTSPCGLVFSKSKIERDSRGEPVAIHVRRRHASVT